MKGKKLFLSRALYFLRLLDLIKWYPSHNLIVFNYHRLYTGALDTQFDDGVFGSSVAQFAENMKWLKNNTEILSFDDLIEVITKRRIIAKRSTLITFDDGYVDNYNFAYPILKQLCIPAIFFIPTGQINSRQLGWWDIIAYLIKHSNKPSIPFENKTLSFPNINIAIRYFQQTKKTKSHKETVNLLTNLSEACNVPLPDIKIQSKELMTWDQIREVSSNGITIGSHTHSHRVLSTITTEEQKEEMIVSKNIIEDQIGKKIYSIAYPVGNKQHFTSETMALASECGYEAAFSFNTGINYLNDFYPFNIKRIEPSQNIELLAATTFLPRLFI